MAKRTIIGVTGGLATGKSTVADMFVAKGAVKIDADAIAHELLLNDAGIIKTVIAAFGDDIVAAGKIDRRKLAARVFSDKDGLARLSRIMHPAIIRRMNETLLGIKEGTVVIDAPLLIEAGLTGMVDVVVVVTAARATQIKRATERGISKDEAEAIIASQMPLSEKEKLADHIIDSDKEIDTTKKGVDGIWKKTRT
jgi:dephospho-CoA kinase